MGLFDGLSDIAITPKGDLIIEGGDLKRVSGIEWFIQEVNKILRSSNDWFFAPNAGASLDRFYGENNTRDTAAKIEELIRGKIMQQGIHFPADLKVKVVPISRDEIKLYITLEYAYQTYDVTNLVFDMQKGSLIETQDIVAQQSTQTPIKHPYAGRFL